MRKENGYIGLFSIFLSAWDMKGCEEKGMMMMVVRMGRGFWLHHD
jgi:hypothetical protein